MEVPSRMRRPSAPVLATRSEPARSTMVSVDTRTAPPSSLDSPLALLSTTWQRQASVTNLVFKLQRRQYAPQLRAYTSHGA